MNRKMLAASLLAACSLAGFGCSADVDSETPGQSEDALTNFSTIADGGACASPAAGRSPRFRNQFARVVFEKTAVDDFAHIEWYDATTGFRITRHTYGYQRKGLDLELYSPDTVGTPFVMYTLHNEPDGSVTLMTRHDGDQIKVACDLRKGAPNLKLPIAQTVAARQTIPASQFPAPPERDGTCTSTARVGGKVLRLVFEWKKLGAQALNKYDDPNFLEYLNMDANHYVSAELYAPKKFADDVLWRSEVALADEETKFGLVVAGPNGQQPKGYRYGEIVAKTVSGKRVLVLVNKDPGLVAKLGASVELACDF